MRETWAPSLGREDALEEGMATHSSILAWRIPMDREAWGQQSMESPKKVGPNWATKYSTVSIFSSLHSSQRILIRHKLGLDSPLLQMVQWLLISLRIRPKILTVYLRSRVNRSPPPLYHHLSDLIRFRLSRSPQLQPHWVLLAVSGACQTHALSP